MLLRKQALNDIHNKLVIQHDKNYEKPSAGSLGWNEGRTTEKSGELIEKMTFEHRLKDSESSVWIYGEGYSLPGILQVERTANTQALR